MAYIFRYGKYYFAVIESDCVEAEAVAHLVLDVPYEQLFYVTTMTEMDAHNLGIDVF
jgi:hypothetical protein